MRDARVIALAGVFQACAQVHRVATQGRADTAIAEASLASVFRIDADSAAAVFGGLSGVRAGLETLIAQIDGNDRDLVLTQLVIGVLRLERKLARRPQVLEALGNGIASIQRQVDHLGHGHSAVQGRLADLYSETLSQIRPRIVVHGKPEYLHQAHHVQQIRALLLAAVRAAVLWRQVGGNHWRLLLRRRQYAMLARGLLARCALDHG